MGKLWDAQLGRCRQTFRGHVDSVNSICFQPYSNNICTGSGDKTVSLWDCRTGLCIQTFYGHHNAVNSVAFSMKGDMIASTDADGIVRLWDVRMVAEIAAIASGPHPCNAAAFDSSGSSLAVGCDDGIVRFISTETCDIQHQISGHRWQRRHIPPVGVANDAWCELLSHADKLPATLIRADDLSGVFPLRCVQSCVCVC